MTGSTVIKYYFAGGQRVAMRKYLIPQSDTLTYLLGDHLGSTSLAVTGSEVIETRYKPWGEVRFTTDGKTLPTRYTFTGQYSHISDEATDLGSAGFGLLFYNARWVDPALGRFIQADTIVPGGVQGLDRYAYVNNSPINFTDPSGHKCVPEEECEKVRSSTTSYSFDLQFGISFSEGWDEGNQTMVREGVQAVGRAFLREYRWECGHGLAYDCEEYSSAQIFRVIYNTSARNRLVFQWGNCPECNGSGGYTYGPHKIAFASLPQSFYPNGNKTPAQAFRQGVNNVVHELGHAFALLWAGGGGYDNSGPYGAGQIPGDLVNNEGFYLYPEPAEAKLTWRQHPCNPSETNCSHEVFADMFLGWTFGKWDDDLKGYGDRRRTFMNTNMGAWIVNLVSP